VDHRRHREGIAKVKEGEKKVEVETPIDHNFHQPSNERIKTWEASLPPAYFEYRRRWEQDPKNHVVGPAPIHLDIEATSNCNMECIMCPRTDMVAAGTFWKVKSFDFDLYTRLIDEGVKNGLCSLKFNYLGEPTLNRRLVEMIEYAKRAGLVDVMFNTNASQLDETLSRRLIASGLDKLFFSFDSPHRETYNKIRVGGDYDQVLGNIRRFVAIRREMKSLKPFTRVSMVRMKENDTDWEAFKALFEPLVDAVAWVDYMDHSGQAKTDRGVVPLGGRTKKFCCPQLWQRTFIHPDGVVNVCCVDSARELSVGNIHGRTLQEIWTGPEYQRLRDLHAQGRFEEIPTCARCPLAHS
jgi:radical SAM protein with 4Fe4S-binding SPASM domain